MNKDKSPFEVGQKVVFIDQSNRFHKKDTVYTVEATHKCPNCGEWHTTTLEIDREVMGVLECTFCEEFICDTRYMGTDSKSFQLVKELETTN